MARCTMSRCTYRWAGWWRAGRRRKVREGSWGSRGRCRRRKSLCRLCFCRETLVQSPCRPWLRILTCIRWRGEILSIIWRRRPSCCCPSGLNSGYTLTRTRGLLRGDGPTELGWYKDLRGWQTSVCTDCTKLFGVLRKLFCRPSSSHHTYQGEQESSSPRAQGPQVSY